MRIFAYPIYPSTVGADVFMPAGAQLIDVSLNIHQYYVHALVASTYEGDLVPYKIAAYMDGDFVPDDPTAVYIASCDKVGDQRRYHFFHRTAIGGAA